MGCCQPVGKSDTGNRDADHPVQDFELNRSFELRQLVILTHHLEILLHDVLLIKSYFDISEFPWHLPSSELHIIAHRASFWYTLICKKPLGRANFLIDFFHWTIFFVESCWIELELVWLVGLRSTIKFPLVFDLFLSFEEVRWYSRKAHQEGERVNYCQDIQYNSIESSLKLLVCTISIGIGCIDTLGFDHAINVGLLFIHFIFKYT